MFHSLFSRILIVFIAVLILTVSLQALLLFRVYKNDVLTRKENSLMMEAHGIAELMSQYITKQRGEDELYAYMTVAMKQNAAEAWFVNTSGTVTLEVDSSTPSIHRVIRTETFSVEEVEQYLRPVLQGSEFMMVGNFLQRFQEDTITVACPVFYNGNRIIGALFIHCRVTEIKDVYINGWRMILLIGVIAVLIAVILVSWMTRSITRPLREMSFVTKQIAEGHFDQQISKSGPDELGVLASNFNRMAFALEKQEKTRTEFIANVSHELKSPMTSIQGYAQGLLDGTIPETDRDQYLGTIVDESRRLNRLVRELLDLTQIDSGQFSLSLSSFDVNEMIRRVLIRYLDRFEEKKIEPDIDFSDEYEYVDADPSRIEQVLVNLIDNAAKYTEENGKFRIRTFRMGEKCRILMNNSGTVIPKEDLPFLFDRFYKVDKSRSDKKGTGLGLSIVKSILEQHGESISVSSSLENGTTFEFSLQIHIGPVA